MSAVVGIVVVGTVAGQVVVVGASLKVEKFEVAGIRSPHSTKTWRCYSLRHRRKPGLTFTLYPVFHRVLLHVLHSYMIVRICLFNTMITVNHPIFDKACVKRT